MNLQRYLFGLLSYFKAGKLFEKNCVLSEFENLGNYRGVAFHFFLLFGRHLYHPLVPQFHYHVESLHYYEV